MRLQGKVAIITGAASGIGLQTARAFTREGAAVVVADVNDVGGESAVREIEGSGGDAVYVRTDVSKGPDVQALMAAAEAIRQGRRRVQ